MNCCANSFPRPDTLARLSLLIAVLAIPAVGACAQTRGDTAPFQKAALKNAKPCTAPADGEVTALVKNGVELSVTEDFDCDGVPDAYDNCVGIPNRDQLDTNHNGIGDACESVATIKAPAAAKSRPSKKAVDRKPSESAKGRWNQAEKKRKALAADKHAKARSRRRR